MVTISDARLAAPSEAGLALSLSYPELPTRVRNTLARAGVSPDLLAHLDDAALGGIYLIGPAAIAEVRARVPCPGPGARWEARFVYPGHPSSFKRPHLVVQGQFTDLDDD